MRKLASIQTVVAIESIEGADKIELCKIEGWQCVVQKGLHKVGDDVVFCEIDSVLPERPEFEFLRNRHFRIKSIKLRGVLSQGIVFPLSILEGLKYESDKRENPKYELTRGMDVTGLLGVKHYDPDVPTCLSGAVYGCRPEFVPKTDEERIQSCLGIIEEMKDKDVYITTKMDGTSCSIYYNPEQIERPFGVCSRNFDMKEGEIAYWQIIKKYGLAEKLKVNGQKIVIQGEICGGKIQKNRMGLEELDFFVFDILIDDRFLQYKDMSEHSTFFGLKTVPLEKICKFDFTLEQLLEMAKGKYEGTENNREGIVIRPLVPCKSEVLRGRMSFKVVNNEYLLKEEE